MTELIIEMAEEEFLKHDFTSAYRCAITAKILDPFYHSVDQYLEAYRVHWAAANRKTPTGEVDWYAVLNIKERLWRSYKMITHSYVQLAKKISPDVHCSAAAPGAYKLITTAWEILGDPQSRLDFHTRAGYPPPTCSSQEEEEESRPEFPPIKNPKCAIMKRRREEQEDIAVNKLRDSAPKRHRVGWH